jgi:glycine cleavage system aminomethyltransferase T
MRLGEEHYRVVTGGGNGNVDKKWFTDHLPEEGSVQLVDVTSADCTVGLWGPKARAVLPLGHAQRNAGQERRGL